MTSPKTKLSILICTMGHRRESFKKLLAVLLPQLKPDIEIIALFNKGAKTLGEYRGTLTAAAQGEYIVMIDDDDLVPDDYMETIYPLLDGVDYIGYRLRFTTNGRLERRVIHSIRFSGWSEDSDGYYRHISHLNPIKREIALKVEYPRELGNGEDYAWANRVAPFVKTEHFIDREMYFYNHSDSSMFIGGQELIDDSPPLRITHKQFKYLKER